MSGNALPLAVTFPATLIVAVSTREVAWLSSSRHHLVSSRNTRHLPQPVLLPPPRSSAGAREHPRTWQTRAATLPAAKDRHQPGCTRPVPPPTPLPSQSRHR